MCPPRRKEPPVVPLPEYSPTTAPKQTARPTPPAAPVAASMSVGIVNFRRTSATTELAEQLEHSIAFRDAQAQIVLVDNDDQPQPLKSWAKSRPGITLHSFGRNRGFARAVNQGCELSQGE